MMSHAVHSSLCRPILVAGAERELAVLEGTLIVALVVGVGLYLLTLFLVALIAFGVHPLLVLAAKADPHMFRTYIRSLAQQDYYVSRPHPSAPPAFVPLCPSR